MEPNVVQVVDFLAYTAGIVVYLTGMMITQHSGFLRNYNIPEAVTGGLLAALVVLAIKLSLDVALEFDLTTRDRLLVYFFTAIGLNARLSDLIAGGRPLAVLLALTLFYIVLQNVVGVGMTFAIDQPTGVGVLVGSASLIGGHGTSIAWAPDIAASHGVPNALEIGVASATFGLVIASLLGGPIAKWLIWRNAIQGSSEEKAVVGISHERFDDEKINHISIMRALLALHVAIILGHGLNEALNQAGLKLPLFVACLMVAIVMSNTVPRILTKIAWPARTKALALISDFALGLFIAMSLMSMQLWEVADLAGPLFVLLTAQVVATIVFVIFVLFPLMGRDYLAVVLSAGFAGFALGATPTAIANMTAVTKSHGPAPTAFVILPLVGAFFVDITNAFVIQAFLAL